MEVFLPVFCKGVLVLKISHLLKGEFGSDSQAGLAYIKGMTSYLVGIMWWTVNHYQGPKKNCQDWMSRHDVYLDIT